MQIQIKLKTTTGKIPVYKTNGSAGFDIEANESLLIKKNKIQLIPTGMFLEIPEGFELQIRSRSGISLDDGIIVLNQPGTIDSDYRGEIHVILMNLGSKDFQVNKGDRIAQGVIAKTHRAIFEINK